MGFDPLPLTSNPPPLVMDSRRVNMFELDRQHFTLAADLPPTCRTLYDNVAQVRAMYASLAHSASQQPPNTRCHHFKYLPTALPSLQSFLVIEGAEAG